MTREMHNEFLQGQSVGGCMYWCDDVLLCGKLYAWRTIRFELGHGDAHDMTKSCPWNISRLTVCIETITDNKTLLTGVTNSVSETCLRKFWDSTSLIRFVWILVIWLWRQRVSDFPPRDSAFSTASSDVLCWRWHQRKDVMVCHACLWDKWCYDIPSQRDPHLTWGRYTITSPQVSDTSTTSSQVWSVTCVRKIGLDHERTTSSEIANSLVFEQSIVKW